MRVDFKQGVWLWITERRRDWRLPLTRAPVNALLSACSNHRSKSLPRNTINTVCLSCSVFSPKTFAAIHLCFSSGPWDLLGPSATFIMLVSRVLVLFLVCITTGLAATIIQAAVDSPADGFVLPEAQADGSLNVDRAGEFQSEDVIKGDAPVEEKPAETQSATEESEDDSYWGFNSIRDSFQTVNGYFDSVLELMGGRDGVCQYRCRYGRWNINVVILSSIFLMLVKIMTKNRLT